MNYLSLLAFCLNIIYMPFGIVFYQGNDVFIQTGITACKFCIAFIEFLSNISRKMHQTKMLKGRIFYMASVLAN